MTAPTIHDAGAIGLFRTDDHPERMEGLLVIAGCIEITRETCRRRRNVEDFDLAGLVGDQQAVSIENNTKGCRGPMFIVVRHQDEFESSASLVEHPYVAVDRQADVLVSDHDLR